MIPYLAPEAAMPITSCAPRFAEMKARLVIHSGTARPLIRKWLLVFTWRRSTAPMASTKTK